TRFGVRAICTSDDPADSLEYHEQLQSSSFATAVYPTFRPDAALRTADAAEFNKWLIRLGRSAGLEVNSFAGFLQALRKRHDDFQRQGCRLSDHGLDLCPAEECTEAEAATVFDRVRRAEQASSLESAKFASYLMMFFGRLDAEKGWAKQLHLGAYRNGNSRML